MNTIYFNTIISDICFKIGQYWVVGRKILCHIYITIQQGFEKLCRKELWKVKSVFTNSQRRVFFSAKRNPKK